MATTELTCRELVALVTDYLEGALPEVERRRFDAHLAGCAGCRIYLEQMRRTIATVGALRPEDLTPEAEQELLELFRDWSR